MSTVSNANVRATKATGARAKKKSGKTTDSSAHVANTPSAKIQATIADVEAGNFERFNSVEELMADLENSDD